MVFPCVVMFLLCKKRSEQIEKRGKEVSSSLYLSAVSPEENREKHSCPFLVVSLLLCLPLSLTEKRQDC